MVVGKTFVVGHLLWKTLTWPVFSYNLTNLSKVCISCVGRLLSLNCGWNWTRHSLSLHSQLHRLQRQRLPEHTTTRVYFRVCLELRDAHKRSLFTSASSSSSSLSQVLETVSRSLLWGHYPACVFVATVTAAVTSPRCGNKSECDVCTEHSSAWRLWK